MNELRPERSAHPDHVRVLRIVEYTGPRSAVEACVERSIQGEKRLPSGLVIRAATIGAYPEILASPATETAQPEQLVPPMLKPGLYSIGWEESYDGPIGMTDGPTTDLPSLLMIDPRPYREQPESESTAYIYGLYDGLAPRPLYVWIEGTGWEPL